MVRRRSSAPEFVITLANQAARNCRRRDNELAILD
jgi:hypothetical protein